MKNIFKKIFAPRADYKPLIEVRVFKSAILHNLAEFQKHYPKFQFAPVLKSNAYGHGLVQVAKILDERNLSLTLPSGGEGNCRAPFFMVDSFFEALILRQNQIKTKILILGFVRSEQIINCKLKNCSFGIIDIEQLKSIVLKLKKPTNFHLKIDTGMHRQGILIEEIAEAISLIQGNSNFILEGLCSHFADADGENQAFTLNQIEEWNRIKKIFSEKFLIKYFHVSNTAGSFYANKIDANVSRLGIGLYGINPRSSNHEVRASQGKILDLRSALEMISIISSIKKIKAGEKVGYGVTYTAPKDMVVATVPVGYNEGVDRRLSNIGSFKIGNLDCPIVGRVSMNMSSIDITECSVPIYGRTLSPINRHATRLEDEVTIISPDAGDKNSVENIAKLCNIIPYEVLVKIPSNLRRIIL